MNTLPSTLELKDALYALNRAIFLNPDDELITIRDQLFERAQTLHPGHFRD